MYKVLVFGMTSNMGGIESFIMSYYKRFDHSKIHFNFLCNTHDKVAYEDELHKLHSKIFKVTMRSKHPLRYKSELNSFFKRYAADYDCIWVNVNSLANIDYLKLAKKYGIKRRIIHSHNSQNMDGKLRAILHDYNKKRISKYATDFWACSPSAVVWFKVENLLSKYDVILPKKRNYYIETNYSHYIHAHHQGPLDKTREIIKAEYPQYLVKYDQVMKRRKAHMFNMFIMKRDAFEFYCSFMFGVLGKLEKQVDLTGYSVQEQRVYDYISELLMDVFG